MMPKISPRLGILFLFLLLLIPLGIYTISHWQLTLDWKKNAAQTMRLSNNDINDIPKESQGKVVVIASQQTSGTSTDTPEMLLEEGEPSHLTPTPSPTPMPSYQPTAPSFFLNPFYDSKKRTNPTFPLTGITDPYAKIAISIYPDNIQATLTADAMGRFQYVPPKALKNGNKQVTIIVTNDRGGQLIKSETATVVGAFVFPTAAVIFSFAILIGIAAYLYTQKKSLVEDIAKILTKRSTRPPAK